MPDLRYGIALLLCYYTILELCDKSHAVDRLFKLAICKVDIVANIQGNVVVVCHKFYI